MKKEEALVRRLAKYPKLMERMEKTLDIVENSDGEASLADTAEEHLIESGRSLDREALQCWAENQVKIQETRFEDRHPQVHKDSKKNSTGTPLLEKSK